MPTDESEAMNRFFRESRSSSSFDVATTDHATVNAAIRRAAGHTDQPGPDDQDAPGPRAPGATDSRTARSRVLDAAVEAMLDAEYAAVGDQAKWEAWIWSRRVRSVLDENGKLPTETGYNPARCGPTWPDFDMDRAVEARRVRWQALTE
jgi:hypothetical protein